MAGLGFHTGTRVVVWSEKAGLNAYDFNPTKQAGTENHGGRRLALPGGKPGGAEPQTPWTLTGLQKQIDQFVLHYDGEGFSRNTFNVLQQRGLSAHFLLDVDGTIYQTLDLRERAYHATIANSRSIGIEMANRGAFPPEKSKELDAWYATDAQKGIGLRPPANVGATGVLTPNFIARPDQPQIVTGVLNGRILKQYNFTSEQYAALIKLTAALHRIFPQIKVDYPRDVAGRLVRNKLADQRLEKYHGLLGHWHIQNNKIDPGPAFQWDRLIDGARRELAGDKHGVDGP
ncbi:MAG: N-acetylmuramoyl-L-alanine amidase [Cephaloticoccus sp.]|nr:N-acetylmuramoyl-L-alanine amidase [Cephaloticoccus sp.]MCF7759200.1 N-acetylmuramoyl-L-alanine amidase [Cephaloticoccus sp.]